MLWRTNRVGFAIAPSFAQRTQARWYANASSNVRNADPNAVAVVVGASRGIGLAATQSLLRRFTGRIIALCREPESAGALNALVQFDPSRLEVGKIDITNEESIKAATNQVKESGGGRVDLVLNTVGILHENGNMPETSLSRVDPNFLRKNFEVRTKHRAQY